MSLPTADDLFRPTQDEPAPGQARVRAVPDPDDGPDRAADDEAPKPSRSGRAAPAKRPSGRVKHDEKMTVYVTSAELLEIEQTRLRLRAELGLAVDRGRLVREALALVLADFERHGEDSALVRRLGES